MRRDTENLSRTSKIMKYSRRKQPLNGIALNCGYVYEGNEAPKECPACKHPQSYYEVLAENY